MSEPVILVATLYVNLGEAAAFDEFEALAAIALGNHGARITRAIRCAPAPRGPDAPYEIHVVEFPSAAAFDAYRNEPRPPAIADLRARAICRTELAQGWDVPPPSGERAQGAC